MTSTSINQGINEGAKPSSKVLRPPGGGSSDIFGTGAGTQVAPSPSRARAPPSNNIFGGYEEAPPPSAEKPKHDRMKSNVFGGGDPDSAPGSARKSSRTYESKVFGETESNKSDDEREKDKENGEENSGGETENNNDTKSGAPVKSKDVSNPITGETKSFAIGGAGEKVSRPSSRVLQPPGGASTKLW